LSDRVFDHAGKRFGFLMAGDDRGNVVDLLGIRDRQDPLAAPRRQPCRLIVVRPVEDVAKSCFFK